MNIIDIMKRRLLGSREVRNAGWLIGEQIFQMFVSLVVGVLSARYLGPSNYGSLNYTASFVSFVGSIATLSMGGVCVKKLVEHPDEEGRYLGGCLVYRLVSGMVCSVVITLLVWVLNPGDESKVVLVSLQSVQLLFQALYIFDSWFQRHLKSKYVSIGKMLACIVVAAYKIWLLATGKSVVWFAFSNSLTYIVVSIVLVVFYRAEGNQKVVFDLSKGIEVLSESYHFILSGLMTAIYGQMDKIMIGQMLTDADVGYYTTGSGLCGMWIFIPTAVINSFQPMIMESKQSGNEKLYIRRLEQLYSFVIWMCIAVSVAVFVLGPFVIRILYGDAYAAATGPLRIIIWCETFSMIGSARGIWILCENKNKYVKYYLAIGAVVNLVLNAIMIPTMGINGAALATLITQIMTSLIAPLFFRETRHHTRIVWEAFTFKWYRN